MHSSSFSGLGESCAVAIETLNILEDERLIERAHEMGLYLKERLQSLQKKYPNNVLDVRGKGMFQAVQLNFGQKLVANLMDISKNPLFVTYQTVLIGAVARELFERHNILVHFQPGARDILHFMPPFIVEERHVDRLVSALDQVLANGIPNATIRFIAKNIKRVFS